MKLFRRQRKFTKAKSHFLPIFNQQATLGKQAASALYDLVRSEDKGEWARLERKSSNVKYREMPCWLNFMRLSMKSSCIR